MTGLTLVLVMIVSPILADDTFRAYNCFEPKNSNFISHEECRRHTDMFNIESFTILQRRTVSKINGFSCSGYKSEEIGFCGSYSHDK